MIRNILISLGILTLFWCKFIPITIVILLIFVVNMIYTTIEIQNDPKAKNEKVKYFFVILIYLLVFALVYLYMRINHLYMGEFNFNLNTF